MRANLDAVQRAALSGSKLTRQLLAFSRKQVLSPRQLSINDTVTAAVGLLRRVIGDHVDVRPRLRPDLPSIWADAGQMEQVVINLAVNARDAMPDGGRLEIETDTAQVRETDDVARYLGIPPGEYVTLCVSDTGVGMTPEIQAQIFDPFFTTKALGHGTGLGLSTVYGIVKQSGGHVSVQSEPGRGSRFRFYFPLFSGEEAAIPTTSGEYPARANAAVKVLLVEDDPGVREALAGMLTFAGHAIVEAASPDAAVTLFREHRGRFDLVITDMMMPGMTGAELVRELQTSEPGLRAVIMSGYSETVTRDNWRLPPNVVFLEKPVAGASLLKAIRA